MKKIMAILLMWGSAQGAWGASSKARYPQVESVTAPAFQVDEKITVSNRHAESAETEKALKAKAVLKDKAELRTGEKGGLRLALSPQSVFAMSEKTEIEIPEIDWQKGAISEIRLKRGEVRFICQADCGKKITTPLFEGTGVNGDFILRYDPSIPEVELTVVQGEMLFRGLENEISTAVMAGQQVSFKGILENNEPAYDILLKGRKVAKGQMSEVRQLSPQRLLELQKQEEKKKKMAKQSPKSKRLASQICEKPWGELNQCVWSCEKNPKKAKECLVNQGAICVRQRCNANGEWSDRQELPAQSSPCQVKKFVGACDY
jgi:hypothetical protein